MQKLKIGDFSVKMNHLKGIAMTNKVLEITTKSVFNFMIKRVSIVCLISAVCKKIQVSQRTIIFFDFLFYATL